MTGIKDGAPREVFSSQPCDAQDMMGVGSGCSRSARWVAQARLAAAGEWALNEKGIVERAGLGDAARAFNDPDPAAAIDRVAELLAVEWV